MQIVHIHLRVKADQVEAFKQASVANAQSSLKEPGVVRFDVVQQQDDPTRFVFVEVYRDAAAAAAHKETRHYATWRDAVEGMMAEPRSRAIFVAVHPPETEW